MQELWSRLETWLRANATDVLETLRPGATEEQIAHAEALLSVQFPDDFKAAYRIHNGQDEGSGLMDGREFLSLERIQDEWKVWKELLDGGDFGDVSSEPVGPIRTDWWHPAWIPITYDGSGNHDCLDLAPAAGGQVGQIIDFWHDDPSRSVAAASFGAWFAAFVEECEAGAYVYSDAYNGIVDVDDV